MIDFDAVNGCAMSVIWLVLITALNDMVYGSLIRARRGGSTAPSLIRPKLQETCVLILVELAFAVVIWVTSNRISIYLCFDRSCRVSADWTSVSWSSVKYILLLLSHLQIFRVGHLYIFFYDLSDTLSCLVTVAIGPLRAWKICLIDLVGFLDLTKLSLANLLLRLE